MSTIELTGDTGSGDQTLTADIECSLPICSPAGPTVSLCSMSVDTEGKLRFGVESSDAIVPATGFNVTVEPTEWSVAPDGSIVLTLAASVPIETAPNADSNDPTTADRPEDESDTPVDLNGVTNERDCPPFRNPELLAEVYNSCDTFTEMPEALGMDVTAETVRRYMIDYGIHEPASYDTSTGKADADTDTDTAAIPAEDDESETPVVLADGSGLPANVSVETIIDAVQKSNTIYEVTRDLGIERDTTVEMLRDLNVLDLVVGRLGTEEERKPSREAVIERISQSTGTE